MGLSKQQLTSQQQSQDTASTGTDQTRMIENGITTILPPIIVVNPRKIIQPEIVPAVEILKDYKQNVAASKHPELWFVPYSEPVDPVPKHPLYISWTPKILCFNLEEDMVTRQLAVCNRSTHLIYLALCGLWDDTARLGASWYCYPRNRLLLAPGMVSNLFVKAKPRECSPVAGATLSLQLATANLRDTVVAYFAVPISVKFHNYVEPELPEFEGEGDTECVYKNDDTTPISTQFSKKS